jgi:hypothetical protein
VNDTVVAVTALVPTTHTCANDSIGHNGGPPMDVDVPYYPPGMDGYAPAPSAVQD